MQFRYRGYDREGKRVRGTLVASSTEEARRKLADLNIRYDTLTEHNSLSLRGLMTRQMPGSLLSALSRELASYLGSGMTIVTALKLMENQHRDEKRYSVFLSEVREKVDEGQSLYKALAEQKVYTLPDFFLQSLNVAGQSGKLVEVLENMGGFFSVQSKVRKQVANAMAYPLFIFVVAMGMTGFLISFVVPKITGIFKDTGQELPPVTRFVLSLSDFLSQHYIGLLLGLVGFLILFKTLYRRWPAFRRGIDALLLKIPIIGSLIQNHELARFSYILSLMLHSGVSYAQAVQLASTTFGNRALRELFDRAGAKVLEGNRLSHALYLSNGIRLKRNFMQSMALGEESSEVASVMFNLSKLYNEENEERLKLLLSLMEPLMMLLIGGIVGIIVMAMLLPIFSMNLGAKV